MQINLSGHHVEITDGIREAVDSKFSKVASHYPNLDALDVTITVERNVQKIEVLTQFAGAAIAVQSGDNDLYVAIADCAKKLDSALAHRKGAVRSHRKDRINLD